VSRARRAVRAAFALAAVAGVAYAARAQWPHVRAALRDVSPARLAAAAAATLAALYASMLCWRAVLADLGSRLPARDATTVFFVGQLGKYVPGSVWPVVAQMELGRERDVPRRRSAAAFVLTVLVSITAAGVLAAATLPFTEGGALRPYRWAFLAPALGALLLVPRVFDRVVRTALRLARRPPPERTLTGRGIAAALAWAAVQWVLYGAAVALVGGTGVALATGAYALAWVAGFVVVVAPAGAGVREGALALLLAAPLGSGRALAVALVLRLLTTLADLALGLVGLAAGRRSPDRV
jgi:hypothetical protein